MTTYRITPIAMAVYPGHEDPIYGREVTHVELEDEGGGQFIVLKQEDQRLRVELEELEQILIAARQLLNPEPEPGA